MICTVGFKDIVGIPQTTKLLGTTYQAVATKLHGHITTCVLNAFMLTLLEACLRIDVQVSATINV